MEAWGEAYHDDGYVFTWQDGRPYHPDYLTQTVGKLMRQAGIADARPHNLRHFYAAVLISAGYDIEAVSKALGHSSVQITSKIYTALFNAAKAKMAGRAEDLVWKDRAASDDPDPFQSDLQLKIPDSSLTLRPDLDHHRNW
jgi:integrase